MATKQVEKEGFLERLGKRLDNASTWHKRVLAMGAIVGTIIGVIVTICSNFNAALDVHIAAQTDTLNTQLEATTKELENVRLDTLRVQILYYIYHEPQAHDSILKLGYVYFVEYKGDWVMTAKFKEWADSEGVSIPFDLTH